MSKKLAVKDHYSFVDGLFKEGLRLFKKKMYESALDRFFDVMNLEKDHPEVDYYIGLCYAKMGHHDKAVIYLEKSLKKDLGYYRTLQLYMLLGYIYAKKNDYKSSERYFKRALKLNPTSASVHTAIAYVYEKQNRYDQAIIHLKRAVDIDPNNPYALNSLGYIYAELGINLNEAVRYCRRAVSLMPNKASFKDSLGWAYFRKGELSLALKELEEAMKLSPKDQTIRKHYQEVKDNYYTMIPIAGEEDAV